MNPIRATMVLTGVLAAASAGAQGVYVGGTVAAEVVRTSSVKTGSTTYDNGSGEAFAWGLRVGSFVTSRVGVELEYFRPGEIESNSDGPIYLTDPFASYSFVGLGPGVPTLPSIPSIISQ